MVSWVQSIRDERVKEEKGVRVEVCKKLLFPDWFYFSTTPLHTCCLLTTKKDQCRSKTHFCRSWKEKKSKGGDLELSC